MDVRVKRLLRTVGLYKPVRLLMHWRLNKEVLSENLRLINFYRQFIRPGDLVFDVGANIGRRSEVFVKLGAKVVAVEPNPDCAWQIAAIFSPKQVTLERAGVGAEPGKAEMHLCDDDRMSSLSEDWIKTMQANQLSDYSWQRTIQIDVVTLDQLIERHGRPSFLKIDTEGFEVQALSGLTQPVKAISFEYNPEFMDATFECVRLVSALGDYRFNFSPGETANFGSGTWLTADEIGETLRHETPRQAQNYGDVYARLES